MVQNHVREWFRKEGLDVKVNRYYNEIYIYQKEFWYQICDTHIVGKKQKK